MSESRAPVFWPDAEPQILERDLADITAFAPDLVYEPPELAGGQVVHHGRWVGRLPIWPFDRVIPEGLGSLAPEGVSVVMSYSAAHPVLPPRVRVLDPEPELEERTQHRWHVAPGGSLCLLQTEGDWTPETSPVELLLKAAGWRIEYALMKAGVVESMTTNGIVSDPARDHLIAEAAAR
ncbi:hypothetical protein GCM10010413_07240 [Promicromonospora sukumoe]|uniref:Uncharacterized protein n=1 Tax=Promicromonospora sukumoe TaxID=88382 RepID=A0A7W3PC88_9MICO|nr:hypothetical protein [Promicromonospora sukumoe]MBA8806396.1 hypothetical protein [Promicromonospora sukumoe]